MADVENISLQGVETQLKLANQNMSLLIRAIMAAFPQASAAVTHTATAGGDTLPAAPSGFLSITLNGVAFKVPLYDS